MSIPRYPSPGPYDGSAAQGPWEQPGIIPLRPMTVGDILSAGFAVLRRHLLPLGGAAVLVAAISTCVTFGTLAAAGSLRTYADGLWLQDILSGKTSTLPGGILLSTVLGLLVTTIGAPVIAGMASAYTGAQALGHDGRGAVTERLRGRWGVLLGLAAVVGLTVTVGLMLLIVPGVIAYLILVLAAPAAVMERGSVGGSLRRSSVLTRGPTSHSTTASSCGSFSAHGGPVGLRATVYVYTVPAPSISRHSRSSASVPGASVRG